MGNISIKKLIGRGYTKGFFTNCKCRYRVFKGARNTKKSYVMIGIESLIKIISDPNRNILFIRKTQKTHKYSTFSTTIYLINSLKLNKYFKINKHDLEITYKPTGQMMIYRGAKGEDGLKVTSMRSEVGYLTDVYIEEAFELDDYEVWRQIDGSIRGDLPEGLFQQITFCFNAWNKDHWLYEKFFKGRLEDDLDYLLTHDYMDYLDEEYIGDYGKGLYLHISTYKVNEFRDKKIYDVAMEELRKVAPEIYKVEALGMWGNATGATYPEFNDSLIHNEQFINQHMYSAFSIGLDTGLSNGEGKRRKDGRVRSATTMQFVGITHDYNRLCCIDEYFYTNEGVLHPKTEPEIIKEVISTLLEWKGKYYSVIGGRPLVVYVDCADIGFRQGLELEARNQGLINVYFKASTKIKIQTRVDFIRLLMAYGDVEYSSNCKNLIRETRNSNKGDGGKAREDFDDHALNAWEYAWTPIIGNLKRWKTFKQR